MMKKRIIAILTATSITFAPTVSILANVETPELEEKQYIIVTEDKEVYKEISKEVMEGITNEASMLEENQIIVAELTEKEAAALDKEKDVFVEEDIILSGSTVEDSIEELTLEEAKKRKQEIKQKKREALEKLEEETEIKNEEEPEYEWNIQAVNADDAAEEAAVRKVKVAVLDSGVDYVTGINLAGYVNFIEEEEELSPIFQDLTGHGTGIASIISGNGETGIYGVNPNAELYSVKVLDSENKAPLSRIIQGIYWCIEQDMDIINMSFGTSVYSKALEQAVKDAYDAGLLMVGAAGNDGETIEYPAAFQEVMAVAATDPKAEISEFSNTGDELEIAAPGEKIRVASFFDGNQVTHGTSIAVPHVTGAASLLWEKDLTKSNEFIRQLMTESAKEIEGTDECGLLDVGYAEQMYDVFAENFDEEKGVQEAELPENTEISESFEDVNTDETYVEGRWSGTNHQAAVTTGSSGLGFSSTAINIIKQGAVYPDTDASGWKGGQFHPWWHGRWQTHKDNTVKNKNHSRLNWDVNYAAVLEMVTEIALEGGEIGSYMTYDWFVGMDVDTYKEVKHDINALKNKYGTILSSNTKANRTYFLFGCAIHSITDAFAHSTTDSNGYKIKHTNDSKSADNISYYAGRYKMAVYTTGNILKELKGGYIADGDDVFRAIKKKCQENNASFKMIKIKPYINANGYNYNEQNDAYLRQLNINEPK